MFSHVQVLWLVWIKTEPCNRVIPSLDVLVAPNLSPRHQVLVQTTSEVALGSSPPLRLQSVMVSTTGGRRTVWYQDTFTMCSVGHIIAFVW